MAENRQFSLHPLSFSVPACGDSFAIYQKALQILKLESSKQRRWRIGDLIACTVFDRSTGAPVWQTDGQTDRQMDKIAMAMRA